MLLPASHTTHRFSVQSTPVSFYGFGSRCRSLSMVKGREHPAFLQQPASGASRQLRASSASVPHAFPTGRPFPFFCGISIKDHWKAGRVILVLDHECREFLPASRFRACRPSPTTVRVTRKIKLFKEGPITGTGPPMEEQAITHLLVAPAGFALPADLDQAEASTPFVAAMYF